MTTIQKVTSELMLEYVYRVQRKLGRNLKQKEVWRVTPHALAYAMRKRKPPINRRKTEKGK